MGYTYRDLIRKYSADVANGHADTDLTPRVRRVTAVMLNLASNAGAAATPYPPADDYRGRTRAHLADIVWDARPLCEAMVPGDGAGTDFSHALERALGIIANI